MSRRPRGGVVMSNRLELPVPRRNRGTGAVAMSLVPVLIASLLSGSVPVPPDAPRGAPAVADAGPAVAGRPGTVRPRRADPAYLAAVTAPARVTRPASGTVRLVVSGAETTLGGLGVSATPVPGDGAAADGTVVGFTGTTGTTGRTLPAAGDQEIPAPRR